MSERGDYRATYCTFWDDPDVHGLSHVGYRVLTTLKGTLPASGIGFVYLSQLAERCGGVPSSEITAALEELERPKAGESFGWVVRERNIVWIVNGLRYEPTLTSANANHRKFLSERLLAPLGDKPKVVAAFRRYYADWFEGPVPNQSEGPKKQKTDGIPMPSDTHSDHSPFQSIPVHSMEDEDAGPVAEPELTALFLTICANRAVTERWAEQTSPYTAASAIELEQALREANVPPDIARLSIYRQCRESRQPRPPRGINYFRRGIVEADWPEELARRALAASGERPPEIVPSSSPKPPKEEHWRDKVKREEREESERSLARDRAGNVNTRRDKPDGKAWWERMLSEAKIAGKHPTLYAFDRIHEPANPLKKGAA